jgi:hypothetical protein
MLQAGMEKPERKTALVGVQGIIPLASLILPVWADNKKAGFILAKRKDV